MSADNWAKCPRCMENQDKEREKLLKKAIAAYGKVPRDKYSEMMDKAINQEPLRETLREDYEIGIFGGIMEFEVDYRASCNKCGFSFERKYTEAIGTEAEAVQSD